MSQPTLTFLAIFLVFVVCTDAAPKEQKRHLHFLNELENKVLNVNCKNLVPYTDLGLQILMPKGEYQFEYVVSRTTQYSCNLRHGSTNTIFQVSDNATTKECGSDKCVWKAAEDGVYLLNGKTNQYTKKYEWGKKYSDMHFG